ncbi:hypothetical protein OG874_22580 [Nocardia sp. NBC_00565]|uniref:hypothetical protein n=1 Tax=Nocardia sp. NBC_00565 TaxID=2975993 RepID=UPI002E821B4C|nr:hypothetical protein [Nocardia sp. NBC_00565]WUC07704.1 hypothetical protein OG874_22580 [Nocardia sp. NBC_00565]
MIQRLMILAMIPAWVWVLLAVVSCCGSGLMVVVLAVGGVTSPASADLSYQCDSAVGPDPSSTATVVPSTTAAASGGARTSGANSANSSAVPTTNPYAELTIAPDDTDVSEWQRACVSALKSAPYQAAPLQTANTGFLSECAQKLALAQLGPPPGSIDSSSGGLLEEFAAMGRAVIYQASAASATGRCDLPTAANATSAGSTAPESGVAERGTTTTRKPCGQLTAAGDAASAVVVLPNTVAGQASCGQRVDPSAVSAGDLVFWNYRHNAPTRSGIAVSATQIVTVDPASGRTVQEAMPTGHDVRVKRVLGGG